MFCLNSTVGFDSYVTYVFASLVLGARLVVPGPTAHLDPTGMACLIATHGITTMEVGGLCLASGEQLSTSSEGRAQQSAGCVIQQSWLHHSSIKSLPSCACNRLACLPFCASVLL